MSHLVPRRKQRFNLGREGALAELQSDRPAAIDHEVKPSVFPGHRVALAQIFRPVNSNLSILMTETSHIV